MHEMQTIVTDVCDVSLSVRPSVCYAAQIGVVVQKRLNGLRSC